MPVLSVCLSACEQVALPSGRNRLGRTWLGIPPEDRDGWCRIVCPHTGYWPCTAQDPLHTRRNDLRTNLLQQPSGPGHGPAIHRRQGGSLLGQHLALRRHQGKITAEGNRITAVGSLAGYVYPDGSGKGRTETYDLALDYEAQVLVLNEGGTLEARDGRIVFTDCDALTLLLAAGTNYQNQRDKGWKGEHPHERISSLLAAASEKSFDALLQEHVRDYQGLFDRLQLDLGATPQTTANLPTNERLAAYRQGGTDPDLEELLFQYARYMMISSSRPGTLPANLQGLWNMSNRPPWRSDYHTDVNIEMNYWFVDPANLVRVF